MNSAEPENDSANPLPCSPPVITVVSDASVPGRVAELPLGVRDAEFGSGRLERAGRDEAGRAPVDQLLDRLGAGRRRHVGGGLEEAIHLGDIGLGGETREERVGRRDLGHLLRARGGLPGAALGEVVGRRDAAAVAADDADPQPGVLAERRLVDHGVGEPGQPAPLVRVEDLDAVDPGELERGRRDGPEPVLADQAGHQRTPTWTSRKRAGDAPWPTRPT